MIYCVEDDSNIRELVVYTLESTGMKACGFPDGTAFMKALAFETPELVLLDIMLPGEDGISLLKKLKSSAKTKDIPVIMVTAKGAEYEMCIRDRDYLQTKEGKSLPVIHCVKETEGWEIIDCLKPYADRIFDKETFGSIALADYVAEQGYESIELVGLCTDICVVSNALLLKARLPETDIVVDRSCCAGVTPESHEAALSTMQMCQIQIL